MFNAEEVPLSRIGGRMKWLFGNSMNPPSRFGNAEMLAEAGPDFIVSGYAFTDDEQDGQAPAVADESRQSGWFYADIADYARLSACDDDQIQQWLAEAIRTMMANVAANDGRIVHLAGDAVLAEFDSADGALHCAINVQLAARQWNAKLALERQVRFRIGVNFGAAASTEGDLRQDAANLARRLEKLASTGGICVSESVSRELESNPSINLVPMGKQYVKDIGEPVQVFWIEIDSHKIVDPDFTGAVKITALAS